jgi:hypothetical protein
MKNPKMQVLVIVVVVAVIGAVYFYWQTTSTESGKTPSGPSTAAAQASPPPEPDVKYPITESDTAEKTPSQETVEKETRPLPTLEESDSPFFEELNALFGREAVLAALNPQDFIRHVVVTVENSTGRQLPQQFTPFKTLESAFEVSGEGDSAGQIMSTSNFARYTPYMQLLGAVDVPKLVKAYRHYYPLFQAAYHELGMKGYFNDRLIQVIDNLLETPNEKGPIKLVLEGAHYKFADSRLEALSGGQKILLRVGPENAEILKKRLGEIRTVLTHSRRGQ